MRTSSMVLVGRLYVRLVTLLGASMDASIHPSLHPLTRYHLATGHEERPQDHALEAFDPGRASSHQTHHSPPLVALRDAGPIRANISGQPGHHVALPGRLLESGRRFFRSF